MNDQDRMDRIRGLLGERILEMTNPAVRRIFLTLAPQDLVWALGRLKADMGYWHLSTISGVDLGDAFEFLYHLTDDLPGSLHVRTRTPKAEARIPSICSVIPGAVLYEREVQEMFGVVVENIPDNRRLLLSDDWPDGQHPLRKDWKHVRPEEKIPGGKS
ncbi:MAG: NADH-quinone oxidoreductase subunit C [Candidatus Aminicenantes bacterium]|nr:NADH-quinone oxidoreductase subunit C [Candidatus Aminicenantes bacterium]